MSELGLLKVKVAELSQHIVDMDDRANERWEQFHNDFKDFRLGQVAEHQKRDEWMVSMGKRVKGVEDWRLFLGGAWVVLAGGFFFLREEIKSKLGIK